MARKVGAVKSLADQIAELEDPTPKDFDPEDQDDNQQSSDDGASGDEGDDADAGREHYEAVSKSKLRKPAAVELGKQYAGARISRDALNGIESDDDDPFRSGSGASGSESENESVEDNGMAVDSDSDDDINDGEDDGQGDADNIEIDGISGSEDGESDSESEDEEDEDEPSGSSKQTPDDDRAELRRLMASDDKLVAASISQAAKADASKGVAVKKQRLAFDALLNARIKLQKGITAVSTGAVDVDADSNGDLIKSTEAAALTMWNTLNDLRYALANHYSTDENPKKRKRSEPASASTPSSAIWSQMNELESQSLTHRRAVLDKWSRKIRGSKATLPNARGKLLNTGPEHQNLTAILDSYATQENGERSTKRAKATDQPNGKPMTGDDDTSHANGTGVGVNLAAVYDDTPFYQSLLRDLVEQRMSASNGGMDSITMQLPSSLSINPTTGMRKDKVKRAVDTKASKGRKMRYTVHEKLQNFMPPEERGTWSNRAREEFFASLLGKSVSKILGEGEDDEASDVENEDSDDEIEGGLKLFRS